jgi:hypothetical protein
MRNLLLFAAICALGVGAQAQTLTSFLNTSGPAGNDGMVIGHSAADNQVVLVDFGNPPTFELLNDTTYVSEGTITVGATVTWGAIGGFGGGVGVDGAIFVLDHNEDPGTQLVHAGNGIARLESFSDTDADVVTALRSVPFPRGIDVVGTGTNTVLFAVGSTGDGLDPVNILTTTDGNTWTSTGVVGDGVGFTGNRDVSVYIGSGTPEEPEAVYVSAAINASANGINRWVSDGAGSYNNGGQVSFTDPEIAAGGNEFYGSAIDPGIPATETADGERPVLFAIAHYGATDLAIVMVDLFTNREVAVLPITPDTGARSVYGSMSIDTENNRLYWSSRNPGNANIGIVDYTAPLDQFVAATDASWTQYE